MIRDYLPYESAREYMDRGMMKWTGFFLSEHHSALEGKENEIIAPESMTIEERALFLRQAFLSQLTTEIFVESLHSFLIGEIVEISQGTIFFRAEEKVYELELEDIKRIQLANSF